MSKRVLLVDDSKIQNKLQAKMLGNRGVATEEVEAVSNGAQALEATAANKFRLIVADWNMPVMDGVEMVRQLRARGDETPVLMVTSESESDKFAEAMEAGVNSYISKPFTGDKFWQSVRVYL